MAFCFRLRTVNCFSSDQVNYWEPWFCVTHHFGLWIYHLGDYDGEYHFAGDLRYRARRGAD